MSTTTLKIREWAAMDRPREKMLALGRGGLTETELLAILLGSGTREFSAFELAQQLLLTVEYDLTRLARLEVKELTQIKGIGAARAISVVSAMELGRRRILHEALKKPKISSSKDAYEILRSDLMDLNHEEFWILLLNRNHQVINKANISRGGVSGTVVDPKLIFKKALEHLSCAMIVAHNHPSGHLKPSKADLSLTKKLTEAGLLMEIPVLDHLILTNEGYLSFADENLM
jgi:DNA repair protein RadC